MSNTESEASGDGGRGGSLFGEMKTLTAMIQDLEDQLERVISSNDALTADLERERKRRVGLEGELDELRESVRRSDEDATARDALRAEITYLETERAKLMAATRDLNNQVSDAEQEIRRQAGVIEQLRRARADALEEVQSVESQFERAMKMVADAGAQIMVLREEKESVETKVRTMEDELRHARDERVSLLGEVDMSRSALDDIRKSLADAVRSTAAAAAAEDKEAE